MAITMAGDHVEAETVVACARAYHGRPYSARTSETGDVEGTRGYFCSEFVGIVINEVGVELDFVDKATVDLDARIVFEELSAVFPVAAPRAGSLAFFRPRLPTMNPAEWHVAICTAHDTMISACPDCGYVQEEPLGAHKERWEHFGSIALPLIRS